MRAAASTDRCTTGFKFLGWGMVLQGLSRPFVELAGDSRPSLHTAWTPAKRGRPASRPAFSSLIAMFAETFKVETEAFSGHFIGENLAAKALVIWRCNAF